MPKKRSPIFQKMSSLLDMSIFVAKMKKPIFQKLIRGRKLNKFSLVKHYNYGYVQEYQFSPSNSPLLQYRKRSVKKQRSYRDLCSIFYVLKCLSIVKDQGREIKKYSRPPVLEGLGSIEVAESFDFSEELDDSVDERAEKFIERFYQEIRLQREESLLDQFNAIAETCEVCSDGKALPPTIDKLKVRVM